MAPPSVAQTVPLLATEGRRPAAVLLAGAALVAAWLTWALRAEVAVTIDSTVATIEPNRPPVVLAAPDGGALASLSLALGRHVRAGEILATLDRRDLLSRRAALAAQRAALATQIAAVAAQQSAVRQAVDDERAAETSSAGERGRRSAAAAAAATLADQVEQREARLAAAGLLAPIAAARSRADAEERRQAAAAEALAAAAGHRHALAALADRATAAARLTADLARLQGELAALLGDQSEVESALQRRELRAPMAGRLAAVTPLQPGAPVTRGTPLATLLPDGPLAVAARFDPVAGAALRVGQRAWVRLPAGFAATAVLPAASAAPLPPSARVLPIPPAALPATVTAVAPGPGPAGAWEARLVLATRVAATTAAASTATATTADSASDSASTGDTAPSPLARPGEPCRVEVELGRTTPLDLALHALGWGSGRAPVSLHAPAAPEPAQ